MNGILTIEQATAVFAAREALRKVAYNEQRIELFNEKGQKIVVHTYGEQISVDLFAGFPRDDKSERHYTGLAFRAFYDLDRT